MTVQEYMRAVSLYKQIKALKKTQKLNTQRLKDFSGARANMAKSQRPEEIQKILEYDNMLPTYRRLIKNKWSRTPKETRRVLKEATGESPPWESGQSFL